MNYAAKFAQFQVFQKKDEAMPHSKNISDT